MSRRTPAAAVLIAVVLTALVALLSASFAGSAGAHGAPTAPVSRSAECGAEGTRTTAPACVAALAESPQVGPQWDNIRVADVAGRDRETIPDGKLCSAGKTAFAGLDRPRADWPTTELAAGADYTFSYRATIPHAGSFRLYVTKPGFAPEQPLTWDQLETQPFAEVTDPPLADGSYSFAATLPAGLTGRHLIYTIWQNSSSADTYYSCSDVVFGGGAPAAAPAPAVAPAAAPAAPPATAVAAAPATPTSTAGVSPTASSGPTGVSTPALLAGSAVIAGGVLVGAAILLVRHRRR